jgi:1-acyl-sn-glycerol-3-phosphate acyltransferase
MQKIRYYENYDEDFSSSHNQNFRVPENYRYIRSRAASALVYGVALACSGVLCPLFLHTRIKGAKKLRKNKGAAFLYCNHTQPVGDVFIPALAAFPNRIYTVVSPANLGIRVIGKLLPYLGALPLPDSFKGMRDFSSAMAKRVEQGNVITVYPEAHVWEYCSEIRPYSSEAFKYPVKYAVPCFSLTTVYTRRKLGKKPRATVYVDGPFYARSDGSVAERAEGLCAEVRKSMEERAELGNYEYIKYVKAEKWG